MQESERIIAQKRCHLCLAELDASYGLFYFNFTGIYLASERVFAALSAVLTLAWLPVITIASCLSRPSRCLHTGLISESVISRRGLLRIEACNLPVVYDPGVAVTSFKISPRWADVVWDRLHRFSWDFGASECVFANLAIISPGVACWYSCRIGACRL